MNPHLLLPLFTFITFSIIFSSFVTAYFPPLEKGLLSLDVTKIANSEINVSYSAQFEIENPNLPPIYSNTFIVYVPYAIEDERQKVKSLYVTMNLSNSTNSYSLTNCSCNLSVNAYFCCEIFQKNDGKKVKLTFYVPNGTFNASYNVIEDVRVNNSVKISSLNKTIFNESIYNESVKKFLDYDDWANYDEEIKNFTINLTSNCNNDFEKVSKITEWIYSNIKYNSSMASYFQSASGTFKNKQGVCNHFTNLFLVMCRSINISARGIAGEIYNETNYISGHAWAEVFIDKWYPVDPTFGEIGLIDGGRIGFTQTISTSSLLYFDMEPTYLNIHQWDVSPSKFGKPNTTEWENTVNVTTNYTWINKTSDSNNITNGTLQITANITRLNLSGAVTGMISIIPPETSSLGINVIVCEDGKPLTGYFLIPEGEDSTIVTWKLNFTNINLSNNQNFMFPVVIHSLLSNETILNITTYPVFVINPSLKIVNDNNYQLNITVRNIGLRDGKVQISTYLNNENNIYATDNLFVEGGNKTNSTIINFNNVIGSHEIIVNGDGSKFKFFIGSCKGDVNSDHNVDLEDALELIQSVVIGGTINNECSDVDSSNVTDIFDVVKILEEISE